MKKILALVFLAHLLLTACASDPVGVDACKAENWQAIGERDGLEGLNSRFNDRKNFCSKYQSGANASAASEYQSGWEKGYYKFWFQLGEAAGFKGKISVMPSTPRQGKEDTAPVNQSAYQAGWEQGNSGFWRSQGERDGLAGLAQSQKNNQQAAAFSRSLLFNETSYLQGWMRGNQQFWYEAGRQDASEGKPDRDFTGRAQAAAARGVQVDETSYRAGWENGLGEYWSRIGSMDAVSGKNFSLRKIEADRGGLKILEQVYQQSWTQRLEQHWQEAGERDGWGYPNLLEQRIANVTRDGVFVIPGARELYLAAWQSKNLIYCSSDNAFAMGRENAPLAAEACGQRRLAVKRAHTAGQDYEAIHLKNQRVLSDLQTLTDKRSHVDKSLIDLESDIKRDLKKPDRKSNNETVEQDRRRETNRLDLVSQLRQHDRQIEELKRWEDRYSQQMRDLKRDAYTN